MEDLLAQVAVTHSVESLDLRRLHNDLSDMAGVRATIEALLDAYNSGSGTARELLQKQCVLRSLAELLEDVESRFYRSSAAADRTAEQRGKADNATGTESYCNPTCTAFWQHHAFSSSGTRSASDTVDASWGFSAEDHLLLSMFLNETATIIDARSFSYWSRATVVIFPLATAFAYPQSENTTFSTSTLTASVEESAEEQETTRASLESELHSLREIIGKRFTTSMDGVRRVTGYENARRCLQAAIWALVGYVAHPVHGERVAAELEAALQSMLQPLLRVLHEQLTTAAGRMEGFGMKSGSVGRGHHKPTSPLLLSSLLQDVSDVLWSIPHIVAAGGESGGTGRVGLTSRCTRLTSSVTESLLKFAQQYIAHRQQRQMESMEEDGAEEGVSAAAKSRDIFRVYHVQRGVQRVLSVALQLRQCTSSSMAAGNREPLLLISDAAFSGLQAAASAFGGLVAVTDPFALQTPVNVVDAVGEKDCTNPVAAVNAQVLLESWRITAEDSRLRRCRTMLAPPHHLSAHAGDGGEHNRNGEGTDTGDFDFFNEDESAMLGRREAYLKSSLGPVTASALVEMVMLTVSQMDFLSEDALQELHRRGLEAMQRTAAYSAQKEELEKLRVMERRGVEAIAPGKLIEHVKDSVALQAHGMQLLRRVSSRARLERAAFTSVLSAYAHLRGEAEALVRQTQALISRCLVQQPPSLADSAVDELLLQLKRELAKAQQLKEAAIEKEAALNTVGGKPPSAATINAGLAVLFEDHSYYQLTLQVLFMYFATQAPMEERSEMWNNALVLGGVNVEEDAEYTVAGGGEVMRAEAGLTIEVDSPIAFLLDDDVHKASQDIGKKRPREEGENGIGVEEDFGTAAGANGERAFGFLNDTIAAPSTYSHVLCRVLELIRASRLNHILVDVLLQAPVLTRYVWHHLYKSFCLSADKLSCVIGMRLLYTIAVRRPVYRTCAVNLLLQLSLSTHDYARRLAITEVRRFLSTTTPQGDAVIGKAAEENLLRYAKKQLFAIPAYQVSAGSKLKRGAGLEGEAADASSAAAGAGEDAVAKNRARMAVVLNRHLGLFLMLCERQPRELIPALLEVFQQCVDRENLLMMQLLPANADVQRMTQLLLHKDPSNFVAQVLPQLRRRCREARPLVQSMLLAVREQLGVMAQETGGRGNGHDRGERPDGSNSSPALSTEALRSISTAVVGHAKAMYELSGIPLDDMNQSVALPDIRYVAPFLSFLPARELKETYLNTFLLFIQVQLHFQRHYHNNFHRLSARERTYVLEASELRLFQIQVLREVFVRCPVSFQDGVPRGLSRVDFFVFLHRAPQASQLRASALRPDTLHGGLNMGASVVDGEGTSGGVLDAFHEGSHVPGTASSTNPEGKTTELPPISVGTTKEIVNLCLELTRSFDSSTVENLYGPAEVQKALQQLLHPPPIPSQLMATVLQAATLFMRNRYTDFLKFAVQTILTPLERAAVWDTDPQLWKGVLLFCDRYYRECSNFLVNLPDQVLTQALREHPQMCAYFKEEHGNNASFGHILGNL